jgi:hypothetical protein
LSVLRHQVEEDIINGNVDTNRIKLSHRPNGEYGGWLLCERGAWSGERGAGISYFNI